MLISLRMAAKSWGLGSVPQENMKCHFLEGYCIITPEGEEPKHLKGGDVFVIEPGMKGTWEVVETVRKYFVFA
jgi:uncharacterized cupin superfamily protein